MQLTDKEISNVIKIAPFDRYKHAIKNIVGQEKLYSIVDENDDYIIMGITDDKPMVSIWPAEEYARHCLKIFEGAYIVEIELDGFLDELVAFFKKNSILINVFSIDKKPGFVVSWEELKRDIEEELEKYA